MTGKKAANPSAFPWEQPLARGGVERHEGMSLRDYFAAKALQGIIAHPNGKGGQWPDAAEDAYKAADAMLRAREVAP